MKQAQRFLAFGMACALLLTHLPFAGSLYWLGLPERPVSPTPVL
jgi:hypothetical protein